MRSRVTVALATLLLAGCAGPPPTPGPTATDGSPPEAVAYAPWWPLGASWTIDTTHGGHSLRGLTVVDFWNDSATNHFWLGVADRSIAVDHALNDSIPLLGRVHWYILTPHEAGIHAAGMYQFPVRDGMEFTGLLMGREWQVKARKLDGRGAFEFSGTSTGGATLKYDYRPDLQWFSFLEIKDGGGAVETRIDVRGHATGAHGTYYFHRGRDYYENSADRPAEAGREYAFEVKREDDRDPVQISLKIIGEPRGLLNLEVIDPTGETRYQRPLVSTQNQLVVSHIANPPLGSGWKVRFTGSGSFDGDIKVVGLLEFKSTI